MLSQKQELIDISPLSHSSSNGQPQNEPKEPKMSEHDLKDYMGNAQDTFISDFKEWDVSNINIE